MKQALSPLLNRAFEMPADGWYQLASLGEFPITVQDGEGNRKKIIQVVDEQACQAMVNRFADDAKAENFGGILVDFDHFSQDTDKSSRAAGWIEQLQNRADGLWAKIRWSASGEAAVKGGDFRFISPVWGDRSLVSLGGNRVRPLSFDRAGLTNDPNLKGLPPLSNRSTGASTPNQEGKTMDLKAMLLKLLGLPAEATDEQIQAGCSEMENRCKTLANRVDLTPEKLASDYVARAEHVTLTNRNTELLGELVDRDLEAHADVITDKAAVRTQLLANRSGTLAILKGVKAGTPPPLTNRAGAKAPPDKGSKPDLAAFSKKQREAVEEYRLKNRCSNERAWEAVRAAQPDLFRNPEETQAA